MGYEKNIFADFENGFEHSQLLVKSFAIPHSEIIYFANYGIFCLPQKMK